MQQVLHQLVQQMHDLSHHNPSAELPIRLHLVASLMIKLVTYQEKIYIIDYLCVCMVLFGTGEGEAWDNPLYYLEMIVYAYIL